MRSQCRIIQGYISDILFECFLNLVLVHYIVSALLVGRSWDWFPVVSLYFSATYPSDHTVALGSTAPSENDYQEHFLRVKADYLTPFLRQMS